jgi:hypothetical protein
MVWPIGNLGKMREKSQLSLFEPPAQRRLSRAEELTVAEAVRHLRKIGCQVYAAGRQHQVDGKLLSTSQLLDMAAASPAAKK